MHFFERTFLQNCYHAPLPCLDPPPKIFVPFKMTPWNRNQQKTFFWRDWCAPFGGLGQFQHLEIHHEITHWIHQKSTKCRFFCHTWILWVRENMPQHLGSNFWTLPCCWSGHARGGGKEAISGKTCRCLSDDWEVVATKQGLVRKSSFLFLGLKQHQKPGRVSWNVGFGYLVGVFSDVFFRNFAFYNLYLFLPRWRDDLGILRRPIFEIVFRSNPLYQIHESMNCSQSYFFGCGKSLENPKKWHLGRKNHVTSFTQKNLIFVISSHQACLILCEICCRWPQTFGETTRILWNKEWTWYN